MIIFNNNVITFEMRCQEKTAQKDIARNSKGMLERVTHLKWFLFYVPSRLPTQAAVFFLVG